MEWSAPGHLLLLRPGLVREVRPCLVEQILGAGSDLSGDVGCFGLGGFRHVLGRVGCLLGNLPGLVLGRLRLRRRARCARRTSCHRGTRRRRVGGIVRGGRLLCGPRGAVAPVLWPLVLCHLRVLSERLLIKNQRLLAIK
jgi:hypothetical protein